MRHLGPSFPNIQPTKDNYADDNVYYSFYEITKSIKDMYNRLYQAINSNIAESGITASRPTKNSDGSALIVGQMYFDTTLGKPIWWKGAGWVDATGAGV